ncbi:MAG: hypothetical protein ACKVP7_19910 [Hyphomicrobiaceae bacterium]
MLRTAFNKIANLLGWGSCHAEHVFTSPGAARLVGGGADPTPTSADIVPTLPTVGMGSAITMTGELPVMRSGGAAAKSIEASTRRRSLSAEDAAPLFVTWIHQHGLEYRSWSVNDVWHLANEDFAMANDYLLPHRNQFLAALKRTGDVRVQYDKRVKIGMQKWLKTTVYTFQSVTTAIEGSGSVRDAA